MYKRALIKDVSFHIDDAPAKYNFTPITLKFCLKFLRHSAMLYMSKFKTPD